MSDDEINKAISDHVDVWLPYARDLNAMYDAQTSLTAEQARCYDRELQKIGYRNRLAGAFWLWHFPAKWKAEAFLRTIGKWKEAKP